MKEPFTAPPPSVDMITPSLSSLLPVSDSAQKFQKKEAKKMSMRDQMMIAEEGFFDVVTFLLSFVYSLGINLAVSYVVVLVVLLLVDIRAKPMEK